MERSSSWGEAHVATPVAASASYASAAEFGKRDENISQINVNLNKQKTVCASSVAREAILLFMLRTDDIASSSFIWLEQTMAEKVQVN